MYLLTLALTFHSHDYNDTITVLVGDKEKRFTVHKDVICVKSKFFRAACSKRWREGQEKIVRLPEVRSASIFQLYMDWTYGNESGLFKETYFDSTTLAASDVVDRLIGLYLLGDVLDDVKLRNYTLRLMTAVIKGSRFLLHPMQCHRVWRRTVPNSPLRKYVVDLVVTLSSPEVFRNRSAEYPMDLVLQAAIVLMERRQWTGYMDVEALEERLETYMEVEVGA